MAQDDIENRVNHIIGIVAMQSNALNEVFEPLVDMLKRSESYSFDKLKRDVLENEGMAKLDLLEDIARKIATAEAQSGGRYEDDKLLGKIRSDLLELTADVAKTQRGRDGHTH